MLEYAEKIPGTGEFDYYNLFPDFTEIAEKVNLQSLEIVQSVYKFVLVALLAVHIVVFAKEDCGAEGVRRCA